MASQQEYFELLFLLTKDEELSSSLAEDLKESDDNPNDFYELHKKEYFENRGLTKAGDKEQSICYMLDILVENDLVYELDWKVDAASLNDAIHVLSKESISIELITEEEESEAEDMSDLIELAETKLMSYKFGVVQFWLDSDSYPIALVPLNETIRIQEMLDNLFE